jgi:hypothetical protein
MYNTMFEERDKRILYSTAVVRQHNGARCRSSRRSTTNRMKKGFTLLECLLLTVLNPADPERVPFLISRNVVLDRVGPGVVPQLSEDMPLGSRGWMFVTRAGVSYFFSTEISVRFWNTGTEYREILRP